MLVDWTTWKVLSISDIACTANFLSNLFLIDRLADTTNQESRIYINWIFIIRYNNHTYKFMPLLSSDSRLEFGIVDFIINT